MSWQHKAKASECQLRKVAGHGGWQIRKTKTSFRKKDQQEQMACSNFWDADLDYKSTVDIYLQFKKFMGLRLCWRLHIPAIYQLSFKHNKTL